MAVLSIVRRLAGAGMLLAVLCSCDPYIENLFKNADSVSQRASSITDFTADFGSAYSVLLVSDVHFESGYERPEKLFSYLAGLPSAPAACFVLGDLTRDTLRTEFESYLQFCDDLKQAGIGTVYAVPGNHDCDDGGGLYLSMVYPYKSCYRINTPGLSYYFLDSAEGSHGDEQISNLKAAMGRDAKKKIVLSHYPLYSSAFSDKLLKSTERAVLITLFAKSNVLRYICGHTHKQETQDFGSFTQTVLGDLHWSGQWAVLSVDEAAGTCTCVQY